jgi:photosystem II stability/assembly factor-like uncharacterized protein
MSRGQYLGTRRPKRAWLPAIFAGALLLLGAASVTLATQGDQNVLGLTNRSWENYFGVTILPSNRIIIVGDKGIVMISDDQGQTWKRRQLKKGYKYFDLYSVAFTPDGSAGWAVGDGGVIYHSDDKGSTWTLQKSPDHSSLLKVAAIDNQKACAVGENGAVLCTADGGANWTQQTIKDLTYFDVVFTDATNGWAVGEFGTSIHTTDAGKTWTIKSGGERSSTADPFFAVAFGNPTDGLMLGLAGASMETANGGQNWQPQQLGDWHDSLFTIVPLPSQGPNDFFAGGENGSIARIDNGKISLVKSGTSNAITALAFSSHAGIAVGLGGTILRSDDNGSTWQVLDSGRIVEAQEQ